MNKGGRWDNKGTYVLYLEFATDTVRLIVYVVFFSIILIFYGIPLHIIRQLYHTFTSFKKRVDEVRRYQKATQNMNARFPNATPQELAAAETCIVCRDNMTDGKKLPCGHIIHLHCLRSWLERQQVCPTCRTPVLQEEIPQQQQQQQPQNWNPWMQQQAMMGYADQMMMMQQMQQLQMQQMNNAPNNQNQNVPPGNPPNLRQPAPNTPNTIPAANFDPLSQLEIIQNQIVLLNQQLQVIREQIISQNTNPAFVPHTSNFSNSPAFNPNEAEEDEELLRALELSRQSISIDATEKKGEMMEQDDTEELSETERVRQLRLLKFSSNSNLSSSGSSPIASPNPSKRNPTQFDD